MNTHLLNNIIIIIIICLRTGVIAGTSLNEPLYTVIGPIYPVSPVLQSGVVCAGSADTDKVNFFEVQAVLAISSGYRATLTSQFHFQHGVFFYCSTAYKTRRFYSASALLAMQSAILHSKKNFVKMLGNTFPQIHIKKFFLNLTKSFLRDTKWNSYVNSVSLKCQEIHSPKYILRNFSSI